MLQSFIESNYVHICDMQRSILLDENMKHMASRDEFDSVIVKNWMRDYGLFQGIKAEHRELIVEVYIENISKIVDGRDPTLLSDLEFMFDELQMLFYSAVPRKWLSAVSKLLWCSFPNDIVIYDSFVERTLVVLQPLLPELQEHRRVGVSVSPKTEQDISSITSFYINYSSLVHEISALHSEQLQALREKYSEHYPHDIRIIDKALWMIGSPNQSYHI
ncbi:TPA: hypothetical protein I7272_24185 [Vibrio parahaemolyticus]|uniref:hypothetical protein n=1 Tax=Vibrio harveyi group TaxID=717610 RepID=UPI00044B12D1|nr:hypothetical protein [Vibrio parahaemolyticus]EXJ26080.1 hypothetical protein D050_4730 [Vibrio parahaemolyticus VPCR-2009]MEA5243582.1 hypothetical protein [Vibrio parahaemolyticus]TOE89272.1 hypothetical protein CGJ33_23695 [Vibrio parahaemolyticus]TOE91617.1 hypothetical protein CGJ35_25810 [Vibrio parahaemolyticus]HAS6685621.1 hypothetical protein [Vibrio parahaemolyticus]